MASVSFHAAPYSDPFQVSFGQGASSPVANFRSAPILWPDELDAGEVDLIVVVSANFVRPGYPVLRSGPRPCLAKSASPAAFVICTCCPNRFPELLRRAK